MYKCPGLFLATHSASSRKKTGICMNLRHSVCQHHLYLSHISANYFFIFLPPFTAKLLRSLIRHLKMNILKSFCFLWIPPSFSCLSNLVEYTSTYLFDQWGSKNSWHHFLALHIIILLMTESTNSIYEHSLLWRFSPSDLDHCNSPLRCSLLPFLPYSKHHFL